MIRKIPALLAAIASLCFAAPAMAQGACDRTLLQGIAEDWVAALERGTMLTMNLGEWVDYQENFRRASLGSFLDKPRKVDWHMALLDTTSCRIYVEAVILDEAHPLVLATQIGNGFFGVGPFSNIVTDEGDWLFDARATYEYARAENWDVLPEAGRATREQLIAAANAYLDLFSEPSAEVPWGEPCSRLEGGLYIENCQSGVPENVALTERQYLVDVERGAVNVFLKFGANARPDSHTFRIENGRLRYIHSVTNCGDQTNCGFPPPSEMHAADRAQGEPAND